MTDGETPEELRRLAVAVAQTAGAELRRRAGHAGHVDHKSSATDPVSDADRASEALMTRLLTEARPRDGLLGEEGADRLGDTGLRWVVDPLDGTVNYLYGYPAWATSVACERESDDGWFAVAGAVHDPSRGETFSAAAGGGSYLGEHRLAVNDPVPLERALVGTGFGYDADFRRRQAAVVARVLPTVRDVRRGGSAALDLCWTSAGRLDGFYERGLGRWDWAAGRLIAEEAGGATRLLGDAGLVVAGPALVDALAALVTG